MRLWDIRNSTCVAKLMGATGVLYSLAWAPDGKSMASSSSEGKVFLYDVAKRVVVRTIQSNRDAVYRVAWNPRDATLLACAGNDGNCVVTRVNGQVQRLLKHSKPVFGCAWSPFETATIATACGDGNVYVWHIAKPDDAAKPWATLTGHKAKV